MPRVLMNYQHYKTYTCHFVQGDARSTIGHRTRHFDFGTLDELDAFFHRCQPEEASELRNNMQRWGRGSAWCNLTDEQYARLEQVHSRKPAADTQHSYFQRVWEGWEDGFMAFHAFHTLSFPWPVFATRYQLTGC